MLYLGHDFYNITFKIKQIRYSLWISPPLPPEEKFWVRTCNITTVRKSFENAEKFE
jgi:hypothetical protein